MDDFVISNLHESTNEWCNRLVSIFTPLIIEGVKSIFNESWKMCLDNNENSKYLMTFQNLLSRIPKWNSVIIEEERNRIVERSGCNYLEDLITCVHIIQLKVLTCIRVGNKQKKIDISIPKLDVFIHKIYIHVARKLYTNVYLFEKYISQLEIQKNAREVEIMVQSCILNTIRESIPTEDIIRAYLDESVEHEEEVTIEPIESIEPIETTIFKEDETPIIEIDSIQGGSVPPPIIQDQDLKDVVTRLKFNDYDSVLDGMNTVGLVNAPKTLERLEEISNSHAIQRKLDEATDDDTNTMKFKIHDSIEPLQLDDINDIVLDVEELY